MKNLNRLNGGFRASLVQALVIAMLASPMLASADAVTFDPAPVLATVAAAVAFITAIGTAVLGLIYVAKGFKWARKAG